MPFRACRGASIALALGLLTILSPTDGGIAAKPKFMDLTVRLFLYGQAPEGEAIRLQHLPPPGAVVNCDECYVPWYICGGPRGWFSEPGGSYDCEARDEPYVERRTLIQGGRTFRFNFIRSPSGRLVEDREFFGEGAVRRDGDRTITAYYDYRTGRGGLGKGPGMPETLPNTGAGAMGGTALPAGPIAASLTLVVPGLYLALRRWR